SFLIDWIYSIDFVDDFVGVAAGMGGSVTNTINWGDTWQFNGSITPDFEYLYGVNFATESMVYMVGADGLIYVSSNGGSSWSLQESEVGEDLNAVHFPSENIGYAVGNNGTIIKFGQSVSISNPSASQFIFNVFPNPVIDKVSITFSSASQGNISSLRLLNSLGQELPMEILFTSGGAELDLSSIEPGAYFIEMETQDQGTLVSRLLKE
ncbi:MAG: T9SS type A sorting domain-containing protein, partial [Flavobacteriales bacterium]|nr:T9SS type A sorting domain-containing protein [Flavobacteriales bacterium]